MKRYKLTCLKCGTAESIMLPASEPEKPWCPDCEEDVDIEEVKTFVLEWSEYLKDREELLAREKEITEEKKNAEHV